MSFKVTVTDEYGRTQEQSVSDDEFVVIFPSDEVEQRVKGIRTVNVHLPHEGDDTVDAVRWQLKLAGVV